MDTEWMNELRNGWIEGKKKWMNAWRDRVRIKKMNSKTDIRNHFLSIYILNCLTLQCVLHTLQLKDMLWFLLVWSPSKILDLISKLKLSLTDSEPFKLVCVKSLKITDRIFRIVFYTIHSQRWIIQIPKLREMI